WVWKDSLEIVSGPQVYEAQKDLEPEIVDADKKSPIRWCGSGTTYFAALLAPVLPAELEQAPPMEVRWEGVVPPPGKNGVRAPQPSPVLRVSGMKVPKPGTSVSQDFVFYAGPKADKVIFGEEEHDVMLRDDYILFRPVQDKGMTGFIADGLFLILNGFHLIVRNWGVAIILLTLLIRACMTPLSRRQMKSTLEYGNKMKKIKPKLDALKEKYKNNRQKQSEMQMKLMRENNVPLMPGGCLLTFLQLPIWIALYSMLQMNWELRHAPFLWIDDMSAPDRLMPMTGFGDLPFVPDALNWLNLLPIVMAVTMAVSTRLTMTSTPADDQQAQMQKMMQWMMPVMMLFFLYDMPAGLCLYITISSTWGIVESKLVRKSLGMDKPDGAAAAESKKATPAKT
ncbi:MAG: YidC/Oxa1 family membrane protein insertase, partial [Planctomycetota bacterium]